MLEQQVHRMLADPRARSLATNFAGQWLNVRGLELVNPDTNLFPDYTDDLIPAFREELYRVRVGRLRQRPQRAWN